MAGENMTNEDTIEDEDPFPDDTSHRNYDAYCESVPAGTQYASTQKRLPGCKRRANERLGCTRVPFIAPQPHSGVAFAIDKGAAMRTNMHEISRGTDRAIQGALPA